MRWPTTRIEVACTSTTVAVCLVVLILTQASMTVTSDSMQDGIRVGDILLVDQLTEYLSQKHLYPRGAVDRETIVVLREPGSQAFAVKRVVGIGGDMVAIRRGVLYVNGKTVREPYVRHYLYHDVMGENWPGVRVSFAGETRAGDGSFVVPAASYFLLSDSRDGSSDSRQWGPVGEKDLIGIVRGVIRRHRRAL